MTAREAMDKLTGTGSSTPDLSKQQLDVMIARTQARVTYGYMFLFGGIVVALIFMRKEMDPTLNTLLVSLSSVLGTIMVQQSSFWFARQRTAGVPSDPNPPQVGPVRNIEQLTVQQPPAQPAISN